MYIRLASRFSALASFSNNLLVYSLFYSLFSTKVKVAPQYMKFNARHSHHQIQEEEEEEEEMAHIGRHK